MKLYVATFWTGDGWTDLHDDPQPSDMAQGYQRDRAPASATVTSRAGARTAAAADSRGPAR